VRCACGTCSSPRYASQLVTDRSGPNRTLSFPGSLLASFAQGAAVLLRAPAAILSVQEAAQGGGQETAQEATQAAAQGPAQGPAKTSMLRFTKPAKALAAAAAAQGAAQGVALPATDDGSDRSEGCEVHAAFGAAFRLGGEPLIRAVLAPQLVRTVAALMAESPAGDVAKRAKRVAAEVDPPPPPEG
jgi:hypothetical protein